MTTSAGKVPIPTIVTSVSAVFDGPRIEEPEVQALTDFDAAAVGGAAVDQRFVGRVRVREPARPQLRELDGEAVANGREERGRDDRIDAVGRAEEAGVDALRGDAVDCAQRLLRLLGRLPERDRGVGRVSRGEDAVVRGGRLPRGGEAREAEPEPEPEEHARRGQRPPVACHPAAARRTRPRPSRGLHAVMRPASPVSPLDVTGADPRGKAGCVTSADRGTGTTREAGAARGGSARRRPSSSAARVRPGRPGGPSRAGR